MRRYINLKSFVFALLILAGGFIIVKNSLDEHDISGLNRDVEAMYQDRLMAANYIYRMNDLLHKKRAYYADAVNAGRETIETPLLQKELKDVILEYEATRLTADEGKAFLRFKQLTEGIFLKGNMSHLTSEEAREKISRIESALLDLRVLADIQVKEASVIRSRSENILSGALLALRLELVVMVLIALFIIAFLKDRVLLPSKIPHVQRN